MSSYQVLQTPLTEDQQTTTLETPNEQSSLSMARPISADADVKSVDTRDSNGVVDSVGGFMDDISAAVGDVKSWMGFGDSALDDDFESFNDCDTVLLDEDTAGPNESSEGTVDAALPDGLVYNSHGRLIFSAHDYALNFLMEGLPAGSVSIISSGSCTDYTQSNCTSLTGLSYEFALTLREEIVRAYLAHLSGCDGATLPLSGGSEAGHATSHAQDSTDPYPGASEHQVSHGFGDDESCEKVDVSLSDGVFRTWLEESSGWTHTGDRGGSHPGPIWTSPSGKIAGVFESTPPHFDVYLLAPLSDETDLGERATIDERS